jgi:hypothetical protein
MRDGWNQILRIGLVVPISPGMPVARVRSMDKGMSLGKEAVLADSGWAGDIAAGVGRVRRASFPGSQGTEEDM